MLQVALKQLKQAAALFKEALLDSPDDWTSLQHYLDCTLTQTTQVAGDGKHPQGDRHDPQGAGDHTQLDHDMLGLQVQDHEEVHWQHFTRTFSVLKSVLTTTAQSQTIPLQHLLLCILYQHYGNSSRSEECSACELIQLNGPDVIRHGRDKFGAIFLGCCRQPFRKLKRPCNSCLPRFNQTPR